MCRTTTLHVHHAFWFISLPSLHDHDVKMSNFTFYRERKQATTNFSFSFLTWVVHGVPKKSTPGKFAYILHFWRPGINAKSLKKRLSPSSMLKLSISWGNSRHFAMPTPVSTRNDICGTSAEILYWWHVTTQIRVVLLIQGWSKFSTSQKHYPDLGSNASSVWNFCAPSSDFISRKKKTVVAWRCDDATMSAVFSGYLNSF